MPKNIEDIIVPERKRSIRNIPIPENRRKNNFDIAHSPSSEHISLESKFKDFHAHGGGKNISDLPNSPERGKKEKKMRLWGTIGVVLLFLIFTVLSFFDGATISYIPKSSIISFNNDQFSAQKSGDEKLLFSVIKLTISKGAEVAASGEKEVSRKASGKIIVYNNSSKEPLKLRSTTRFETTDGKVFQVPKDITVPGKSVLNGVEKPGILEITVYAEKPGQEFNTGLTDFTLPGLKGTPRYSSVYARSKTEMTGGFIGVERVVSEQDQTKTEANLKLSIKDEIISEAKAQTPDGFVLIPELSSITFDNLPQTTSPSNKNSTIINIEGKLNGIMFKRNDLSTFLVRDKAKLAAGESVDILEIESLSYSFTTQTPVDLLLSNEIKFSVTGVATTVWQTDETALKADLVGKNKRDLPSILNNFPSIDSVTTNIRPFWKSALPNENMKIELKKLPVK